MVGARGAVLHEVEVDDEASRKVLGEVSDKAKDANNNDSTLGEDVCEGGGDGMRRIHSQEKDILSRDMGWGSLACLAATVACASADSLLGLCPR